MNYPNIFFAAGLALAFAGCGPIGALETGTTARPLFFVGPCAVEAHVTSCEMACPDCGADVYGECFVWGSGIYPPPVERGPVYAQDCSYGQAALNGACAAYAVSAGCVGSCGGGPGGPTHPQGGGGDDDG